jgi:hypothetical protein
MRHGRVTAWLALGLMAVAACGSAGPAGGARTSGAVSVLVRDADRGRTVSLVKGGRLTVVLASTYWTFQGSSDPAVVRQVAQPVVQPSGRCVPGGGCGTASLSFDAVGPGSAEVTASRTSCGEAMLCTGGEGAYRVTVVVA